MEKILLYSPEISPRLRYIASHIAVEMLGAGIDFTVSRNEALSATLPLINYSGEPVTGAVNICPSPLLNETGIKRQAINVERYKGLPVFFRTAVDGDPGFDLFAAAFYMLSRYEEYLPFRKDRHGRFPSGESLAFKHGLVREPLVDLWAGELRKILLQKFPRAEFPGRKYRYIPTIDADVPWAYKNRSLWRTAGGFARSAIKGETGELRSRFRVLLNREDDPYDTWQEIEDIHEKAGLSPVYFFSAGTYSDFDKSVPLSGRQYRQLIRNISEKYRTGIHPSYYSYRDGDLIQREIMQLSGVTGKPVCRSRQHYLRLELPVTCRLLAENGISDDYTMGWAELPGFRAGTCTPFLFYDLEKEEASALRIWPFQLMDGTFRDYLDTGPEESAEIAGDIIRKVRDAGGTLITLWHNESLSERGRWKNWKKLYLDIIKSAAP